jgi:hypothetical protein
LQPFLQMKCAPRPSCSHLHDPMGKQASFHAVVERGLARHRGTSARFLRVRLR